MTSHLLRSFRAVIFLMLALRVIPLHAANQCKVAKFDIPVSLSAMRAVVAAKINGHDARFILDSGGFYSMMSSAAAAEFNLKLGAAAPGGVTVRMISGNVGVLGTVVKDFELEGLRIPNVEFLVGGPEMGADNIGLLGQNFLEKFDVEYDLARGMVRLFKVEGCENTVMAYWVRPGEAYSMIDIARTNPGEPHTIGTVSANGKQVRALFDTGAPHSMMDRRAARNAGVDLQAPGVTPGGEHRGVKTYMAPFKSFRVGDGEEIKNPRLKVVDMDLPNTEMLIGIDFFLSHRIFVANSQHKMYLTYNGGPVFDLENSQGRSMAAEGSKDAEQPVDAAAYARRGEASAQRGDFEQAIADLTRASDLDPNESEYFYQRGMAHWRNKQAEPAQADFDQALLLKPDDAPILMARAQLRITGNDIPGALTDLDAADSSAPKQADYRFSLGMLYERADRFQSAVAQYDLWIANHSDDRKLPSAYSKRCWARMMQGVNLDKALSDCNFAVRTGDRAADYAELRYSRGFIRLRMGELNKAISDFDASVKSDPKNASALYGRGLARQRQGNHAQADADISAAITMDPKVTEYFDRHGITH